MSFENQSRQEKVVLAEVNKLIERLSRKGFECVVMVSATDNTGGATVGAGEWSDEVNRAVMVRESLLRLQEEYVRLMTSLAVLSGETAGNA